MGVRPVVRYPARILKRPAPPAGGRTEAHRAVARDLLDTMRASPATVGLAAPQIGESLRAFAMDASAHPKATSSHGLLVLFDPEVLEAADGDVGREGCLSVPDLTANVRRARRLVLRGIDLEGDAREYRMEGFEARVALHEIDHLDGMLILDRATSPSDLFARRVYR